MNDEGRMAVSRECR